MSVRQSLKSRIACYGEERQRRLEKLNNSPVPLRGKVMKLAHDNIMSGHQGVKKTYDRVVAHLFWPGVHGDVVRYCNLCDICQ